MPDPDSGRVFGHWNVLRPGSASAADAGPDLQRTRAVWSAFTAW
jgi:hypothetical protein